MEEKEQTAEKRLWLALTNLTTGAVVHLVNLERKQKECYTAMEKVQRKIDRLTESRDVWKLKYKELKEMKK